MKLFNMKLYLARHGRTRWNREKRCQGFTDIPLDSVGRRQAGCLRDFLSREPIRAVYSSDLSRAAETARIVAEPLGLEVIERPGLRELNQGVFEGLVMIELMKTHADFIQKWIAEPATLVMPEGESMEQVAERAWRVIEEIREKHPGGDVLAVTHNLAIQAVLCRATDTPLGRFRQYRQDPGSLSVLSFEEGRVEVELWNDTSFIPEELRTPGP